MMNKVLQLALGALLLGWISTSPALAETWRSHPQDGACLGGRECSQRRLLELRLEDAPVHTVRFFAHDDLGRRHEGHLRVRIDDLVLERDLSLDRRGREYALEGGGFRGRYLIFEPVTNDEVVVDHIEIEYRGTALGSGSRRAPESLRADDRWQAMGRGWQRYRLGEACIGGARCSGRRLEIDLLDAPVESVRFYAHDRVGERHGGRLKVILGDDLLAPSLDIKKDGQTHVLEGWGRPARRLIFEALEDDEVVIESLEVEYEETAGREDHRRDTRSDLEATDYRGDRNNRHSGDHRARSYDGPGECLGGDLCGQRRSLEIVVESRPISGVRFFAHDDIGTGHRGLLRIFLDRETLAAELDIPRAGDFFEITLPQPMEGRYLTFEAFGNDEVVVEDIEVNYGGSWVRHRVEP